MQQLLYRLLDWFTDRLVDVMIMIEPRPPRRQELDYHVSKLPLEILAIIRISWYKQGKADEVDEVVLMEDGEQGYEAFSALIQSALNRGANISVRSGYQPEDLGIFIAG
jgi:hypothetical protein